MSRRRRLSKARARAQQAALSGGYDVASKEGRLDNWWGSPGTADTIAAPDRLTAVQRCRELQRNNPWAQRAGRVLMGNIVGTGIRPRFRFRGASQGPRSSDPAPRRNKLDRVQAAWRDWSSRPKVCHYEGNLSWPAMQAQVIDTLMASGEVLVRRYLMPAPGGEVDLRLRTMEPDHLDTSVWESETCRDGIEYWTSGSMAGRPMGYHLFPIHPGDVWAGLRTTPWDSQLIPAEEVLHVFQATRPGQRRGFPWLHSVAVALRELGEYQDATLTKQKIAGMMVGVIRAAADRRMGRGEARTTTMMQPGTMRWATGAEGVEFANPPRADDYQHVVAGALRGIAAGLGISFEALTGDLSQVNFSSARMGWIEFGRQLAIWRGHMLIPLLLDPVWEWWRLAAQAKLGNLSNVSVEWTPPRRELIDPAKEVPALAEAVRSGFLSLTDAIAEGGRDPDLVLESIAETMAMLDRLGITVTTDPRSASVGGAESGADDQVDSSGTSGRATADREGDGEDSDGDSESDGDSDSRAN